MKCEMLKEIVIGKPMHEATRAEYHAVYNHLDGCEECGEWMTENNRLAAEYHSEEAIIEQKMRGHMTAIRHALHAAIYGEDG